MFVRYLCEHGYDWYKYYANVMCLVWTYLCVHVFIIKTRGYQKTILTYVCVCSCVGKLKHKAVANMSERNCYAENESAKRQNTRKKTVISESVQYIGNRITRPVLNARFTFAWDKFRLRGRSWKHRHVIILSNHVPETI